jgi:hypothetical protein
MALMDHEAEDGMGCPVCGATSGNQRDVAGMN